MIVEAENAAEELRPVESVKEKLQQALEKKGLTVVSAAVLASQEKGDAITIFLKEGYVVARIWPRLHYCAFDIHLWSSFEKHNAIKHALVGAVGSNVEAPSSYRIVAGGMFGVDTWKDDLKQRGPDNLAELCDSPSKTLRDKKVDPTLVDSVLKKSLRHFSPGNNTTVAVLCGHQDQSCASVELLEKMGAGVVTLRTCPNMHDGVEYAKGGSDLMFACETEMFKLFSGMGAKVDVIVIDSSAPFAMGQILYRLSRSERNVERFLAPTVTVLAVLFDQEVWRRSLVDLFRENIFPDDEVDSPVFGTEIRFNTTDSSFGLVVLSRGNEDFLDGLAGFAQDVETSTGLASEILKLRGGNAYFQDDWNPRVYRHDDYDQSSGLEQWMSQKVVGFQSVMQFEMMNVNVALYAEGIKQALEITFSLIIKVEDNVVWQENQNASDGCVVTVLWGGGGAVVLWDGRKHVDVNFFTNVFTNKAENIELAESFEQTFAERTGLTRTLRDEQPRGTGRVVSFDAEPGTRPIWG
jgi:hypothetical protein